MASPELSYAGVGLCVPTDQLIRHAERVLPADLDRAAGPQGWPAAASAGANLTAPPPRVGRVGTLYWPTGASRYAVAHFPVTKDQLTQIRTAVGVGVSPKGKTGDLILDTGNGTVTVPMYALPPRPLAQLDAKYGTTPDYYLLTLVDERYFWWATVASAGLTLTSASTATEWNAFITTAFNLLSITPTVSTINHSDWSYVPAGVDLAGKPLPVVIDSILYACGLRLSRSITTPTTYRCWNTTDALTQLNTNLGRAAWPVEAGGNYLTGLANDANGNTVPDTDQVFALPDTVRHVVKVSDGAGNWTLTNVDKTVNAALVAAVTSSPRASVKRTWTVPRLAYDSSGAGLYAAEFAKDYVRRQLAPVEVRYAGVVPWEPTGLEDAVEWTYRVGTASTLVTRPPRHDGVTELIGATSVSRLTIKTVSNYGLPPQVVTGAHPDDAGTTTEYVRVLSDTGLHFYWATGGNAFNGGWGSLVVYRNWLALIDGATITLTDSLGTETLPIARIQRNHIVVVKVTATVAAGGYYPAVERHVESGSPLGLTNVGPTLALWQVDGQPLTVGNHYTAVMISSSAGACVTCERH